MPGDERPIPQRPSKADQIQALKFESQKNVPLHQLKFDVF